MNLDAKIEAILFFKGESVSIKRLAELLDVNEESIKEAFLVLEQNLKNRGLQLIYKEDKVMLGTSKDMSSLLEKINKEELNKELSRASLETLTIILYKPEITRSEIDYIRGVNSSFILRNLSIRGLIERTIHLSDQRKYIYKPSFELLSFLGLSKIEDLPDYDLIKVVLNQQPTEQHEE